MPFRLVSRNLIRTPISLKRYLILYKRFCTTFLGVSRQDSAFLRATNVHADPPPPLDEVLNEPHGRAKRLMELMKEPFNESIRVNMSQGHASIVDMKLPLCSMCISIHILLSPYGSKEFKLWVVPLSRWMPDNISNLDIMLSSQ